jgi:hypothetical protein
VCLRLSETKSTRASKCLDGVVHPALAQHLYAVITLTRVSDDWESFMRMLDKAHPRKTDKWLRELLRAADTTPAPANDSSERLPLLALLHSAAQK